MRIFSYLRPLLAPLLFLLFARAAAAFEPFVIKDIRVEGIQRIEAGTVFSYLPVKVGETMTNEKASAAIRALFGTGFFRDVRIEVERDVLIVALEERPAVASIDFVGMKEFEKDPVKKALRDAGLQEGRIFDRAILEKAEQEIKRQYLSKGKYGVHITTTVTPLERNRVAINFSIDEGEVARIKSINIVGNQAFREKDLLDIFVLRTPGWLTWYTKNDQYSRQKLQGDIESLRSYYQNRGYLDFGIESTQVSITPDRQDIYITINISEGDKYTVAAVKLEGDMIAPEEELRKLITLKPGEVFSREKLTESTKKITDRLGNDGYAFANANAVPDLDKEKHTVAFTILVDPGRRVYVRRINIVGNTRTRDEVARRELRQLEGAFYDAEKLQLSKQRIDKTQYFSDIEIETPPVPGTTDQVDVNIKLKEKPTGSVILGLGFSSSERFIFQGGVQQTNFAGSGKTVGAQVQSGKINRVYSFSYTDPYYTVDGVSRGFDVFNRHTDARSLNLGNYKTATVGGGIRFGVPFTEIDAISFGASVENTTLDTFPDSPARYQTFQSQFGNQYSVLVGSAGWARDSRDSAIWPTKGRVQRATTEASVGNLKYYRTGYQLQWFHPVSRDLTVMLNGEIGVGGAYGGKEFPFFKNYYVGGVTTVRGYNTASLGPRDSDGVSLGGTRKVNFTSELLFPLPGAGLDRSVRLSAFLDGGSVFGPGEKISTSDLRYSAGLAVAWSSPMGPIKINFSYPLNDKPGDRLQKFQFLFGQVF